MRWREFIAGTAATVRGYRGKKKAAAQQWFNDGKFGYFSL